MLASVRSVAVSFEGVMVVLVGKMGPWEVLLSVDGGVNAVELEWI